MEPTREERHVLDVLREDWQTFDEVADGAAQLNNRTLVSLRRERTLGILRSLRRRGIIDSRVSDAHGRTEYALITDRVSALDT